MIISKCCNKIVKIFVNSDLEDVYICNGCDTELTEEEIIRKCRRGTVMILGSQGGSGNEEIKQKIEEVENRSVDSEIERDDYLKTNDCN